MTETKKRKMSAAQRRARKRKIRNRRIAMTVALVLVVALVSVGGTIAWLTAQTGEVVNTFTVGNIDITLAETTTDYKMVPGNTIAKDPTVTVEGGSEACWLFVKIEESDNLDDFITYAVDSGWTQLTGVTGVYYREVGANAADQSFNVLATKTGYANGYVTVNSDVTKAQMGALTDATRPTLKFTAYACQKDNVSTAADAWAKITTPGA